jgi:hypothetical protein
MSNRDMAEGVAGAQAAAEALNVDPARQGTARLATALSAAPQEQAKVVVVSEAQAPPVPPVPSPVVWTKVKGRVGLKLSGESRQKSE